MPDRPTQQELLSYLQTHMGLYEAPIPVKTDGSRAWRFGFNVHAATLSIGVGLKFLIDRGLSARRSRAFSILDSLVLIAHYFGDLGRHVLQRFYYISWVGERVVADVRKRCVSIK